MILSYILFTSYFALRPPPSSTSLASSNLDSIAISMATLSVKFGFKTSLVSDDVQFLDKCASASMMAVDVESHGIASPLAIMLSRISQASRRTSDNLLLRLGQLAKGRFIFQVESPPFEWWAHLIGLCRHIPASGVLQVPRPQDSPMKMVNSLKSDMEGVSEGLCRICFLKDAISEASSWYSRETFTH